MYNMSPYSLSRSFRDKPCRAVIYGRASTEHEAQVKALQNQMQWYDDVARFHPQWNVINRYIDQGITGTQVYKRDAFMRMMEDAKQQKFDLIVTREVCRFARNTVDALVCVRQLAAIGIEVYLLHCIQALPLWLRQRNGRCAGRYHRHPVGCPVQVWQSGSLKEVPGNDCNCKKTETVEASPQQAEKDERLHDTDPHSYQHRGRAVRVPAVLNHHRFL